MAGYSSNNATNLALMLYVHILLLILGATYLSDGTSLAIGLGLVAIHCGVYELLTTFLALSAALVPVDIIAWFSNGDVRDSKWLALLLVLVLLVRGGAIWFGYQVYKEEAPGSGAGYGNPQQDDVFIAQEGEV